MTVEEIARRVQFTLDQHGKTTAVVLTPELWAQILEALEGAEDRALVRAQGAAGRQSSRFRRPALGGCGEGLGVSYDLFVEPEIHTARDELPGNIRQRVRRAIGALAIVPRPPESATMDTADLGLRGCGAAPHKDGALAHRLRCL